MQPVLTCRCYGYPKEKKKGVESGRMESTSGLVGFRVFSSAVRGGRGSVYNKPWGFSSAFLELLVYDFENLGGLMLAKT